MTRGPFTRRRRCIRRPQPAASLTELRDRALALTGGRRI
jgi:hypothetical protein